MSPGLLGPKNKLLVSVRRKPKDRTQLRTCCEDLLHIAHDCTRTGLLPICRTEFNLELELWIVMTKKNSNKIKSYLLTIPNHSCKTEHLTVKIIQYMHDVNEWNEYGLLWQWR